MDGHEKHRFVQQYVERQKAYIPMYAAEGPPNERHDTPAKLKPALRSDEFGFDTPILRPRVRKVAPLQPASPSQSRSQEGRADPPHESSPVPTKVPSDKEAASHNKIPIRLEKKRNKVTSKRRKTPVSDDTDDERAARLADRRERKRKKRAIVDPPKDDESITATSRPKGQKAKKPAAPAALALMYGFSATNVTKDRLTVKPAPSLGVFSKGKASSKKKTSSKKKPTLKKGLFSESAFLDKSSTLGSKVVRTKDSSNDSSLSLVSDRPVPKKTRITKDKQEPLAQGKEPLALPTPEGLAHAPAESEIWDIELQSNLPSSAPEVQSENGAKGSASLVLDLQGAEWAVSIKAAKENSRKVTATQEHPKRSSIDPSSAWARSHSLDDRRLLIRDADTSTVLPCHSASQVGRLVADIQPPAPRLGTSKYFSQPVSAQQETAAIDLDLPQISNSGLDLLHRPILEQHIEAPPLETHTSHRVESPINSLISVPRSVSAFRTSYDSVAPLEFSSDYSPYAQYGQGVDAPQEPQVRPTYPSYAQVLRASSSDVEFRDPLCTSYLSPAPALEYPPAEACEDAYETTALQYPCGQEEDIFEDDIDCQYDTSLPAIFQAQNEDDPEESYFSERGFPMTENPEDVAGYERESVDASIYYQTASEDDQTFDDSENEVEMPEFLEGRALLLGVSEQRHQMPPNVRLSGLLQAEMDVASRLRDHWRPLRL